MTLYEINKELETAIEKAVDKETGELIGDLSVLEELRLARNIKLENIGLYIKNLNSEAERIKEEERVLQQRRKIKENKVDRLREYLLYSLNGEKFETPRVAMSYRKSTSVNIYEPDQLPQQYCKTTIEPDKTAIKTALRAGVQIAGAQLVEKQNLQIK